VLESESVLDIHHYSFLYKPCWSSKPFVYARVDHTSERERESDQLLIRSILVLLFSFEVPLKNIKKSCSKKKKKKKTSNNKEELCVCFLFVFAVVLVITFVSRLASLAQSSVGPTYYHC
jgi:hypothetical protein